jgi:hypothetical protein
VFWNALAVECHGSRFGSGGGTIGSHLAYVRCSLCAAWHGRDVHRARCTVAHAPPLLVGGRKAPRPASDRMFDIIFARPATELANKSASRRTPLPVPVSRCLVVQPPGSESDQRAVVAAAAGGFGNGNAKSDDPQRGPRRWGVLLSWPRRAMCVYRTVCIYLSVSSHSMGVVWVDTTPSLYRVGRRQEPQRRRSSSPAAAQTRAGMMVAMILFAARP